MPRFVALSAKPRLLTLPWDVPLQDWPEDLLVSLPRGISRHVVRFVRQGNQLYALKEAPHRYVTRELRLLRDLDRLDVPAVDAVGAVVERTSAEGEPLDPILITEHLQFSLPYRALFSRTLRPETVVRLVDALAALLVRLHLTGFFWGDCSLSNTLFRRDAGAFAAYLVDAETGELHDELSPGQRAHDLELARTNIFGELLDLQAAGLSTEPLQEDGDQHSEQSGGEGSGDSSENSGDDTGDNAGAETELLALADRVVDRYQRLWAELTEAEEFDTGEMYRIERRIARLNELGFDVAELDVVTDIGGRQVRIQPKVVDAGHHSRRLLRLTGLDVEENQARRLLNDLDAYRAATDQQNEDEELVAHQWLTDVFEPVAVLIPSGHSGKLEPAEIFHEVLEHRWFLSEHAGSEVSIIDAARSYVHHILSARPDEKVTIQ